MTATLKIRLHKYLGGTNTKVGAVGQIYAIDASGERDYARDRLDLLIPAGHNAAGISVDLEPGQYMVEAKLPSGDVASSQVKLADGASFDLALEATTHSPHEWLSWQQYLGNVPPRPEIQPTKRPAPGRGTKPSKATLAPTRAPRLPAWPDVAFIGDPVDALSGTGPNRADAWRLVVDPAARKYPVGVLAAGMPTSVPHRDGDTVRRILTVGADGPITEDKRDPGRSSITPRRYLVGIRPGGPTELACLPLPWSSAAFGRVPIEVLIRRAPLPGEAMIAMSPRDPGIGSALGFMGTGNLENARLVFDSAKDLLFGKMANPMGAAAGGYVLLATEHGPGEHRWHGWIANLANRFDWLPDGMIQYGRLRLARRQDESDIDAARTAFFEAFDRGLPYYSMGLQWLLDGLSLLASRDDKQAHERLAAVQDVVWRANLAQPFTTIRLRD